MELAIADPDEVGVCVSRIQAKTELAQSTVSPTWHRCNVPSHPRREVDALRRDEERIAQLVDVLGRSL